MNPEGKLCIACTVRIVHYGSSLSRDGVKRYEYSYSTVTAGPSLPVPGTGREETDHERSPTRVL